MGQHKITVDRNQDTIEQYAKRIEQINNILNSYNVLIEEKRKYEYYLRTQVHRGNLTKEEFDIIKNKGLDQKHPLAKHH
jgi:hypothetical protein